MGDARARRVLAAVGCRSIIGMTTEVDVGERRLCDGEPHGELGEGLRNQGGFGAGVNERLVALRGGGLDRFAEAVLGVV